MVTGAIIGVVGLYVCFIGHRFFHVGKQGEFPVIITNGYLFCITCVWLLYPKFLLLPTLRGSHSDLSDMDLCGVLHSGSTLGMV